MSDAKLVTIGLPLFLSLLIASGSAGILKGPVTYPENGHHYYLLEQSTWLEALRESQRLDGHLASFTSEQEAQWLYLYHTEGKRFRLRGEVWLGGNYESKELPFPSDLPHGFTLWLREWSGVKRYAANTDGLRVKRRLHDGKQQDEITWPVHFDSLQTERWYRFYADVSRDFIYFHIGPKSGLIKGPLAVDGANKIVIAPGTKLRNLRLEVSEPLTP